MANKVMRVDGTAGSVRAYKTFTGVDEIFLTFDLLIEAADFAMGFAGDFGGMGYGVFTGSNGNGIMSIFSEHDVGGGSDIDTWWLDYAPHGDSSPENDTVPAPLADTWQTVELHFQKGVLHDVVIDGTTVTGLSGTNTETHQVTAIAIGQSFGGILVFIDNVKVGTTRGGTDIFSDDFESGSLSAGWTGTVLGTNITVVDDPLVPPGLISSGTVAATSTISGSVDKVSGPSFYVASQASHIITVFPDTGFFANDIGDVLEGATQLGITGMAWDPVDEVLWAVTRTVDATHPSSLISIDPTDGTATFIGSLGLTGGKTCGDISCNSAGELYGWRAGSNGCLVHINKSTGAGTEIGSTSIFGGAFVFISDVAHRIPQVQGEYIATVNLTTGALTNVVVYTGDPFAINAAEYINSVLYACYYTDYAAIDLGTGVGTFVSSFPFSLGSVDAIASVPVPPAPEAPSPPVNDDFANAQLITGSIGSVGGTVVGATPDYPAGGPDPSPEQNVWYKWTPASDGRAYFSSAETGDIYFYTGSTFGTAVFVDYATFYVDVTGGVEYHISVGVTGTDFTLVWSVGMIGTILATSTVSGNIRHTHQPITPTTGIAATSTVSGAIRFRRITPTTGIAATSTVSGRIVHKVQLHPSTILATAIVTSTVQDIIVYVPPEVFTHPGGPGYPLLGPAAANPDGYFIDSLSHSFDVFQTYRGENLSFIQRISDIQTADWEISTSQVNANDEPIVWRRIVDNADFILPWQNHYRIRYKEDGVEDLIQAGFIRTTNSAKGRDFIKVSGVDWLAYLDRRMIPFNPLEPEATYAAANFFGPSTPPTGYSYQVAGRDIYRIVHDILEFVLSKPRSLPLDISDPGTSFMGTVINYALALGDTSTALNLVQGLSDYWPAFDFIIGYNRNFAVFSPARFGDPNDTANSGPDGDNIAYAFGDDFNHPIMDCEYTNDGVQATHVLGTGAGTTANRVAKAIGAGDIQRQFWRQDISVDYGDQAKTQDIVAFRTRSEFIFRAREVHEIELTIDPSTVLGPGGETFHQIIKPGYAIWVRDLPAPNHLIDSAQKILSIEMTVNNQGDRIAKLGLNQIYETDNETYGVNEA